MFSLVGMLCRLCKCVSRGSSGTEPAAESGDEARAPDDLTAIRGLGKASQDRLQAAGIKTYAQLAQVLRHRPWAQHLAPDVIGSHEFGQGFASVTTRARLTPMGSVLEEVAFQHVILPWDSSPLPLRLSRPQATHHHIPPRLPSIRHHLGITSVLEAANIRFGSF